MMIVSYLTWIMIGLRADWRLDPILVSTQLQLQHYARLSKTKGSQCGPFVTLIPIQGVRPTRPFKRQLCQNDVSWKIITQAKMNEPISSSSSSSSPTSSLSSLMTRCCTPPAVRVLVTSLILFGSQGTIPALPLPFLPFLPAGLAASSTPSTPALRLAPAVFLCPFLGVVFAETSPSPGASPSSSMAALICFAITHIWRLKDSGLAPPYCSAAALTSNFNYIVSSLFRKTLAAVSSMYLR
ncbi:hypothetical protein K431DRAFT_157566 [Polychaeton citri CBS 116435]|uniref:Uncharacterized protein n=1 Tax=Polychaeton citri CBS 116435 TaxID=1314669 RepID=A0A9P4ULX7_9PEZI|nr:hypothetical protein K431DRAFT_157566 [Polychaeton citri CBS 116435]